MSPHRCTEVNTPFRHYVRLPGTPWQCLYLRPDPHGAFVSVPILDANGRVTRRELRHQCCASLSGLEFTLPPSQPLTPPAHPLPLCIDLALSSCDLRLSDCDLSVAR